MRDAILEAAFIMWPVWLAAAFIAIVMAVASLDAMAHEPAACVCPEPPPCAAPVPAELLEQIEAATATIEAAK